MFNRDDSGWQKEPTPDTLGKMMPGAEVYTERQRALRAVLTRREPIPVKPFTGMVGDHLSVSTQSRYPTMVEIMKARTAFLPLDRAVFMYVPPTSEIRTAHVFSVHLWCPDPDAKRQIIVL